MGVEGKVALVTGASQGIGRATALKLGKAGAKVVLAARTKHKLDAVAAELPDSLAVDVDVTEEHGVDKLYAAIKDKYGRLDVVFNNAGNNVPAVDFGDLSFHDWRKVQSLNLDACFLVARGAYRLMREQSPQGGRIINNGSISAHSPRPGSAAYTASKHAITGLTKTIALDGRQHHIACCQVDIGNAMTEMAARMATGVIQANREIAIEAVMDADNVAETVLYMASLPAEANALFVTVMATKMPFVGRG